MDKQVVMEACARAAHEVNRTYCLALGDTTQPSWDTAPEWQKASAINGVSGALAGDTPEQSHGSWLAEKRATGWRYGPKKDPEKKEHPCFVPYADLPATQQAKDHLFTSTVREVAKALGGFEPVEETTIEEVSAVFSDVIPPGLDLVKANSFCIEYEATIRPGGEVHTRERITELICNETAIEFRVNGALCTLPTDLSLLDKISLIVVSPPTSMRRVAVKLRGFEFGSHVTEPSEEGA